MIYLGIGSNLTSSYGNRFQNIKLSISLLKKNKIEVVKSSSFYESESFPNKNNPKFINIVVQVQTKLGPEDLMRTIFKIESKLERKRKNKNEPRTCDIDIIDYKKEILDLNIDDFNLKIPHISLTTRDFVLYPLREISPNWQHPFSKLSVDFLINNLRNRNNDITKLKQNDIINHVK